MNSVKSITQYYFICSGVKYFVLIFTCIMTQENLKTNSTSSSCSYDKYCVWFPSVSCWMLLMVLHLHLNIFPLHQVCRCTKYSVDDFMLKPSKLHEHKKLRAVWPLVIYMKKNLRIWLAENGCIFHVTQVQITSRVCCQNFVCLDFLWCVFHVNYEKVTKLISHAIWCK